MSIDDQLSYDCISKELLEAKKLIEELFKENYDLKNSLERKPSESNQAEIILESEANFKAILDDSDKSIILIDLNGIIKSYNKIASQRAFLIFGKEIKTGDSIYNFVSDSELNEFNLNYKKALNGEKITVKKTYKTTSGCTVYYRIYYSLIFDPGNKCRGLLFTASDITESENAKIELEKFNGLFQTTVNSINYSIHIVDRNMSIIFLNDFIKKEMQSMGMDTACINKNLFDVFTFLDKKSIAKEYEEVFNTGKIINSEEKSIINGKPYYSVTHKCPVVENNRVLNVITYILDITQYIEIQNMLIEAKEKAELSNEAKNQFLNKINHEIRTPMNGIAGFAKLLSTTELTSQQKEYLDYIDLSFNNLYATVNNILDYSDIEKNKIVLSKNPFNLNNVVNESIDELKLFSNKKKLKLSYLDSSLKIDLIGDESKLKKILCNLIENAIKFTEKGNIEVKSEHTYSSDNLIIVELTIKDTGIGIPDDKLIKILEKFEQMDNSNKRKYGGVGLGLTIAIKLIEIMKGNYEIISDVNGGTTVKLSLPFEICRDKKENELNVNNFNENGSYKKIKILIVDDEFSNRNLLTKMLLHNNFEADASESAKSAMELMSLNNYDAILMDIEMPEMNGLELSEWVRKNKSLEVPIIAVSAYTSSEDVANCLKAGMNDFIAKPLKMNELINKIKKYVYYVNNI